MAKPKDKYEGKSKEEIIQAEKQKLNRISLKYDKDTKKATASLIDEAAFMAASLYELRRIINEKGYTEEYQNGANQRGIKKASEVEIYNALIKNYQATVKQLTDLIPKEERMAKQTDGDDFFDFLGEKGR